jgi:hypothetical protein
VVGCGQGEPETGRGLPNSRMRLRWGKAPRTIQLVEALAAGSEIGKGRGCCGVPLQANSAMPPLASPARAESLKGIVTPLACPRNQVVLTSPDQWYNSPPFSIWLLLSPAQCASMVPLLLEGAGRGPESDDQANRADARLTQIDRVFLLWPRPGASFDLGPVGYERSAIFVHDSSPCPWSGERAAVR